MPLSKYSPDQPRVPTGNSDGGQWTDGGGGGGSSGGGSGSRPSGGSSSNDGLGSTNTVVAANTTDGPKILGRGPKDFGQRVNTPSPKDVKVKMDHVIERHTVQGPGYVTSMRDGGGKTAFPASMKPKDIEKAVREAYSNAREVSSPQYNPNGLVRLLEGKSRGLTI
jgi:hypothetical protein